MKKLVLAGLTVACLMSKTAHADEDQILYGFQGAVIPQENALQSGTAFLGTYVSYEHTIAIVYVGLRLATLISLATQTEPTQLILEPSGLFGLKTRGEKLAARIELGLGPIVDLGSYVTTTYAFHTYLRAAAQYTFSPHMLTIEAFVGPSFLFEGTIGVFPEFGIGVGQKF